MMKAIGYIRVSSEEQAQPGRFSLERQRVTIEQRAARDGYEVVQWAQDVESGEHVNREGYQGMLTFLRKKGAERVYIWESSRLGRNDREFLRCCWELEDLGIEVVSCTQDLQNVLLRYVYAWKASEDNVELGKRVAGGLKTSAGKGNWIGIPPYGYKRDPSTKSLVANEHQAPIVKEIFALYLAGHGARYIIGVLNGRGLRSYRDLLWGITSTRKILANRVYTGQTTNKYATVEGHEPLVSQGDWEMAQQLRLARTHAGKGPASTFLLSGIAHCGYCEGKLIGSHLPRKSARYLCNTWNHTGTCCCNSVIARDIEAVVIQGIEQLLDEDTFRAAVSKSRTDQRVDVEPVIAKAKRELAAVTKMVDKAYDLLFQEVINREEFTAQRDRLIEQRSQIAAQLVELEERKANILARQKDIEGIQVVLDAFRRNWADSDIHEQKVIIRSIVKGVYWRKQEQEVVIKYRF
jgi:site-specific DNA recombinase